jgi:hypothetical protein
MSLQKRPPGTTDFGERSRTETLVSLTILLALAAIAATMLLRQVNYSSPFLAALAEPTSSPAAPAGQKESDLSAYAGTGLSAMSPMESFTPDDLYKKIDGRADLYLTAGMIGLRCQRLAGQGDGEPWVEVFVYDMGSPDNAFTVYSKQKRPGVQELTELAYQTPNSLHFAHGRYYVEILASADTEPIRQAMREYRDHFLLAVEGGSGTAAKDMALFPSQDLRAGSISRSGEDDFGIKGFQNVFLAVYRIDGVDVTAFLHRCASPKEASDLAAAYRDSFGKKSFGGQVTPTGQDIPGGFLIKVLDTYKIVFSRGPFVAGVHESPQRQAAEKVAASLARKLSEMAK